MNKRLADFKNNLNTSFLFKLTWRSFLFLFLENFVLLILYLSGNFQPFMDSTQKFLLMLCSFFSIIQMLFSFAGIVESIVLYFIEKRASYWIYFGIYAGSLIFSVVIVLLIRVISFLSNGF
ncbi:MAG: hypothetical protein SO116_10150 [Treponema sp.]|nr:hypothetical protein [Spirochaetales bacterium]MDY4903214.1 hypothetical protein [Treponema sp.]